jgi:Co/Zn/Cd efflux system component
VDLGQRLADQRSRYADLLALDPDALVAEGDHLSTKASSMTIALLPLGFAALFGAMAQPFWRRRRLLIGAATGALGFGLAIALMVEAIG